VNGDFRMSQGIDFKYVFRVLRRRFYQFFLPFILISAVGTAVVMSLPAIYSADAKILVESQQIPDSLVKSTVTALASERLQVIQQRVLTRDNLLTMVDKFSLFSKRKNLSRSDIVDIMRDRITFQPIDFQMASSKRNDKLTTAFAIQFDYEDPALVEKVANELVKFILEEDVRARSSRASDTTKFLQREAQRLSNDLSLVQSQISEFKLQNTETLPEKLAFNMSLLERTERNVGDLRKELATNEEQQRLVKLEADFRAANGGLALGDADKSLAKQLSDAKLAYSLREKSLAPKHPEMKMLRDAISVLEKKLNEAPVEPSQDVAVSPKQTAEAQLYQAKLVTLIEAHKISEAQLTKSIDDAEKLRAVIVKTPESGAILSVLERKEISLQKDADVMGDKYSQAQLGERLEQDQQAEKFQVIEQPVQPQTPSKPKRLPLLAAVLGLALAAGAVVSGGVELLDKTIRREADVISQLKQRPIVIIPYIKTKSETRGRWLKLLLIIFAWLLLIAAVLFAVNQFYRPVDEIFYRVFELLQLNKLG
jgi:polysaccharide biosynthesis transport protein